MRRTGNLGPRRGLDNAMPISVIPYLSNKVCPKIEEKKLRSGLDQGAKKIIFTACHSGKLKLAFTSPDVISTSPKNFLTSRIDLTVLLLFEFLKKITYPSGKLKTELTSPIAKSTSPGLSDSTFFARC